MASQPTRSLGWNGIDWVGGCYIDQGLLEQRYWERIVQGLRGQLTSWAEIDQVEELSRTVRLRQALNPFLPQKEGKYIPAQLSIWEGLLRRPMCVPTKVLARVMPVQKHKDGQEFYVKTWSLSVKELQVLMEYLQEEEKLLQELHAWEKVISEERLEPHNLLHIRYIGFCDSDEQSNPSCGVVEEFLLAVERALPQVARSVKVHDLLVPKPYLSKKEASRLRTEVYIALVQIFGGLGGTTLTNRYEHNDSTQSLALWKHAFTYNAFEALNTKFNERAIAHGTDCSVGLARELSVLFKDIKKYVSNHRDVTGTASPELALGRRKRKVLQDQSTPFLFQGRKSVMVFTRNGMYLNDYVVGRSYFAGENREADLMRDIVRKMAKAKGMDAAHFELFPYYCLAPWPKRDSPKKAVVTLGMQMAGITQTARLKNSSCQDAYKNCPQSYSLKIEDYLDMLARPTLVELEETFYFIHVPLLDPGRIRYESSGNTQSIPEIFMDLSMELAVLTADSAMEVLEYWDDVDPHSREMCEAILTRLERRLDSVAGRDFISELNKYREEVKKLARNEPLMFPEGKKNTKV